MANPQKEDGFVSIANELFDALCRTRINGEARQIFDAVCRKTYGYGKKEDRISTSQFMEMTGLKAQAVHKARKKLIDMNMITITQKGNTQVLTYSIQKDYEQWKLLPKKVTVTQKGKGCYPKRLRTVTQKGNKLLPKKLYTIDNKQIDNSQKKEIQSLAMEIISNHPRIADKKASLSSVINLLGMTDDKVGQYPELDFRGNEVENIVKARFQLLRNCQANYAEYCKLHKVESDYVIQSNNFFGRAERWREYVDTRELSHTPGRSPQPKAHTRHQDETRNDIYQEYLAAKQTAMEEYKSSLPIEEYRSKFRADWLKKDPSFIKDFQDWEDRLERHFQHKLAGFIQDNFDFPSFDSWKKGD